MKKLGMQLRRKWMMSMAVDEYEICWGQTTSRRTRVYIARDYVAAYAIHRHPAQELETPSSPLTLCAGNLAYFRPEDKFPS